MCQPPSKSIKRGLCFFLAAHPSIPQEEEKKKKKKSDQSICGRFHYGLQKPHKESPIWMVVASSVGLSPIQFH
jgi:hypothetical protein